MAEKIEVRYDDLDQIANAFNQLADETQHLLQIVQSNLDQLRGGGWIGLGADRFYDEMDSLVCPAIERTIHAFEHGSDATRQISRAFHDAEEEAGGIFQRLA